MVMAAGLGTRMRPLTDTRPKPLVEVGGTTLIDRVLAHLARAGVERVVVNLHYLADMLEAHLRATSLIPMAFSDERDRLMETGGGLVRARALLGDAAFFCVNSDNVWTDGPVEPLGAMAAAWDEARMDALLLMVPTGEARCHAGRGDFRLGEDARIVGRKDAGGAAPYVWTGVQLVSPRLIADWPEGPSSTNLFWDRAIAAHRAFGRVHRGLWFDVGTPAAIALVEAALAAG